MKIIHRFLFAAISAALIASVIPMGISAQEDDRSPEEILAVRYSPIAYVKIQEQQGGVPPYEGEPYLILPVEMILDNERRLIRDGANSDEGGATGISAQELATLGPTT